MTQEELGEVTEFKGFKCGNELCEAIYESESDANYCHPVQEVTAYACPKCQEAYEEIYDARECCEGE